VTVSTRNGTQTSKTVITTLDSIASLSSHGLANWGDVTGEHQLETIRCVGKGGYLVSLLVWVDLTQLKNGPRHIYLNKLHLNLYIFKLDIHNTSLFESYITNILLIIY
jgi:hypothetical protein